jgi:hypothetical protein
MKARIANPVVGDKVAERRAGLVRLNTRHRRLELPDESALRAAMREEIQRELHRSRRYQRPFVLLCISTSPGDAGGEIPPWRLVLRNVDRVWTLGGRSWILLPESGIDDGLGLLQRLRDHLPELLSNRTIGVSTFPESAVTFEGLVDVAENHPGVFAVITRDFQVIAMRPVVGPEISSVA